MKRVKSVTKTFFLKSVKSLKEYSCVSAAFVHLLHVRKEKKNATNHGKICFKTTDLSCKMQGGQSST